MASLLLLGVVAFIHLYILWLEMFAWTTKGPKVFGRSPEFMESTKVLGANQGLYNGFLAAGLIWAMFIKDPIWHEKIACFFLVCVGVAGIYGSITASKRILYVQTVPAMLALAALLLHV